MVAQKIITDPLGAPRHTKTFAPDGTHQTTIDSVAGLEWQAIPFPEPMDHESAAAAVGALQLRGGGWTVPTDLQLLAIINQAESGLTVDPNLYPGNTPGPYWTSLVSGTDSGFAGTVDFYDGAYRLRPRTDVNVYVRAVRPAPAVLPD